MLMTSTCSACDRPFIRECRECWRGVARPARPPVVPAALAYDGVVRRLLVGLKYANGRGVVAPLGRRVAALVRANSIDVVTWAPTSDARRRARGFDQAELLARAVAGELGVPCKSLLRREHRHSAPQTGRSRVARSAGPSFVARRQWRSPRVLVVDDVVTTGATLHAARSALLRAGAAEVRLVAAAATP